MNKEWPPKRDPVTRNRFRERVADTRAREWVGELGHGEPGLETGASMPME